MFQTVAMLGPLFTVTSLQPPDLWLTRPAWAALPSSNIVFCLVLGSY